MQELHGGHRESTQRAHLGEQANKQAGRQASMQARKQASTLSAFSRSHALEGLVRESNSNRKAI